MGRQIWTDMKNRRKERRISKKEKKGIKKVDKTNTNT
jgi:hypothetical protein